MDERDLSIKIKDGTWMNDLTMFCTSVVTTVMAVLFYCTFRETTTHTG
jgi:hypothetical protein